MIGPFRGQYEFLSNFYHAPFRTKKGSWCKTVEHAFQACKTLDPAKQRWVLSAQNPGAAKKRGRSVPLRPDWEKVKVPLMKQLLKLKFQQNADIRQLLLATGTEKLVEVNWWGDKFWGVVDGEGENWLGRLLMEVREELRAEMSV